jgi:hypothetical protein
LRRFSAEEKLSERALVDRSFSIRVEHTEIELGR